jgi:hypothetical protein
MMKLPFFLIPVIGAFAVTCATKKNDIPSSKVIQHHTQKNVLSPDTLLHHNIKDTSTPIVKSVLKSRISLDKRYRDATEIGATEDFGGGMIGSSNYGINRIKIDSFDVLLLDKIITHGYPQKPEYIVLDYLALPALGESLSVIYSTFCMQHGMSDSEIVALVHSDETDWSKKVIRAWRANITSGKFEEISPEDINCVEIGSAEE